MSFSADVLTTFPSVYCFSDKLSLVTLYYYCYYNHFTALWILSGTTRVSRVQKKHSPTHTCHSHQSCLICFLHLLQFMTSSLFDLRAWQSFSTISKFSLVYTSMALFQQLLVQVLQPFYGPWTVSMTTRWAVTRKVKQGRTNLLEQETVSGSGISCTSPQTDNHTATSILPLSFLQARCGCPSCRPANSIKALNACYNNWTESHPLSTHM